MLAAVQARLLKVFTICIQQYIRLDAVYTHPVREKLLSAKGVFSSHAFLLELGGLHEFSCSAPS